MRRVGSEGRWSGSRISMWPGNRTVRLRSVGCGNVEVLYIAGYDIILNVWMAGGKTMFIYR